MDISGTIKGNLDYSKELLDSGIAGAKEARETVLASNADMLAVAAQESWQAASVGVMAGAIIGALADDDRPVRGVVVGGLLGALAGFVGSFAWKARPLISAMASEAGKRVGTVRDRRWLSKHPMNYG